MPITLDAIARFLDGYLGSSRFPTDQRGIYHPSQRPIHRLGLALEPWPGLAGWVQQQRLDALFLHRPWRLNPSLLPADIGILAYHLSFDLTLTFGFNSRLADLLQMTHVRPFAYKEQIPYGMVGTIPSTPLTTLLNSLTEIFGAPPISTRSFSEQIERLAVVGAMNDTLIREAASYGVQLYLTGQMRHTADAAVAESALTVAAIGHAPGEEWGVRSLAGLLRERWSTLETCVAPVFKIA